MSDNPDRAGTEGNDEKESPRTDREWRHVTRDIWAPTSEDRAGLLRRLKQTLVSTLSSVPPVLIAIPMLLFVPYTFILAYELGGNRFFGLVLVGIWSFIIVVIVVALEKTGYARNYQNRELPLRRIIALPVAFLVALGLFYLMAVLGGAFR